MDDWADRFAEGLGVAPMAPEETGAVLRLAREVAHRTDDRKLAPLASFLAGVYAGSKQTAEGDPGGARPGALREALEAALRLLPEEHEES